MEKRRVRLNINGVVCGLITGESEEYMQALAQEVGNMMRGVMAASPLITREAAALTAALSLCDDCHKNADLARRLGEKNEELEVEAELWQEEKVELLKSAVDTQKDAKLSEKAARLESENTRLQERLAALEDLGRQAQRLRDENSALREAAGEAAPKTEALARENNELKEELLRRVREHREQAQNLSRENDSLREELEYLKASRAPDPQEESKAQALTRENQGLKDRLNRLGQEHETETAALQARVEELGKALEQAQARQQEERSRAVAAAEPRHLPHGRRNPLRRGGGQMEQEGFKSYFALEGQDIAPMDRTVHGSGEED